MSTIEQWARRKAGTPRFAKREGLVPVEITVTNSKGTTFKKTVMKRPAEAKKMAKEGKGRVMDAGPKHIETLHVPSSKQSPNKAIEMSLNKAVRAGFTHADHAKEASRHEKRSRQLGDVVDKLGSMISKEDRDDGRRRAYLHGAIARAHREQANPGNKQHIRTVMR